MNSPRVLKRLLKLCGLLALAVLMVFGAILSCGKNNMTETTPHQAAAQDIKEVSKTLMIKSRDSNYKKCFSFDSELFPIEFPPHEFIFYFKNIGYFSGIEKSPGKFGGPGMSRVSIYFFGGEFGGESAKQYYINSFSKKDASGKADIAGEYKEFYLYDLLYYSYLAIDKTGLFAIEYKIGDGKPRNKQEWTHDLQLIIDFIEAHTIPCQGES
ncbi:hypothetical protein XFPR_03155 [Xylella fastidiosa]|uniref:hypothetical protein n=1 Tax=Xylella fastidiosa TaxID=2371 RepID=UPI0003D38F80|nr:hypothetical protein [Xylella fastidiosa]ALR03781.1 hypothetical protein XFPR_03155 [Xylella fastidiosa]KXB22153.1 hypothetical protein ADT30_01955 [Xylella fastidiosa]OJZ71744.1 hypothetical protein B375_0203100 [Xylella fastidiosa 6c]